MTCCARVVRLRVLGLGRDSEALEAFEAVLQVEPHRESCAGGRRLARGRFGESQIGDLLLELRHRRRPLAVILPRRALPAVSVSSTTGPRPSRRPSAALEINPANLQARRVLVASHCATGNKAEACARFDALLNFDPPDREALMKWFEGLR